MANNHSEVWDDSLLLHSWNEALEEYKHYHSIHARGERVEDVLKNFDMETNAAEEPVYEDRDAGDQQVNDPHAKKSLLEEAVDLAAASAGAGPPMGNRNHPLPNQASDNMHSNGPALPQHLIGQVHDENLKNLLMSWYYAGYYTGLYEGQQQGAARK